MRRTRIPRQLCALGLAAAMLAAPAFVGGDAQGLPGAGFLVSEAASAVRKEAPLELHLDVNSRQTSIYDGYTCYVMGHRVSENDTFTITRDKNEVNLDEVTLNYYLITYNGDSQKYLECTVPGVKEGVHYPVVRPETVSRERETGYLYDYLERCYMVELCYQDQRNVYYFILLPEEEAAPYRNILLGKWDVESRGWRYYYQERYLTSWAQINEKWYYFGTDGYMKTGWQQYKGCWYYLDPNGGAMKTSCTVDGYELDENGIRIS